MAITHSGVTGSAYIVGIVGLSDVTIQNCLNYGTLTNNGTTKICLYVGGILGYTSSANNVENCVSGGKIVLNNGTNKNYIGTIVGQSYSGTTSITHCYWTINVGNYNVSGSEGSTIDSETKQVNLNTSTVDSLNNYATSNYWNKWLFNTNNKTITFKINNGKGFTLSSQLILLPDFTGDGEDHTFSSWFEDEEWTKGFTSTSVDEETILCCCCSQRSAHNSTSHRVLFLHQQRCL